MSLDYIFHGSPTSKKATGGTVALAIDVTAGKLYYRDDSAVDDEVGFQPISAGSSVSIDGVLVSNPNFSDTTPAAPSGKENVTWQLDNFGNVSGYVTIGAAASAPWATLTGTLSNGQVIPYADAGVSRLAASSLAIGNGTNGDVTGTLQLSGIFIGGPQSHSLPEEIHTTGAAAYQSFGLFAHTNTNFAGPELGVYRSRGTQALPTAILAGDVLGYWTFYGYDSTTYAQGAQLGQQVGTNWSPTNHNCSLDVRCVPAGGSSLSQVFRFNSNTDNGLDQNCNASQLTLALGNATPLVWGNSATGYEAAFDIGLSRIGAGVLGLGNGTQGDFSGTLKATIVNAVTGFQNNGTATAGHVLRGNGTNFVDAALAIGDLTNIAGGTVLGNAGTTSGAVSALIAPVLGIPGTSTGSIALASATASGKYTITAPANAATPTLTLPTTSNVLAGQFAGDNVLYSNTPVGATAAGTLALPTLSTQTANFVFAGPTSGAVAAPTFRALVSADLANTIVLASGIAATTQSAGDNTTKIATDAFVQTAIGGAGAVLWSALGNAAADLTLANAGFKTTFNQTSAVPWLWANTTVATVATTNASPLLELAANYWNGASGADTYTIGTSLVAGVNGFSTLGISHSGTTGGYGVGIGTTAALCSLDVRNVGATGFVNLGASDGTGYVTFFANHTYDHALYFNVGNDLRFGTAANTPQYTTTSFVERWRFVKDGTFAFGASHDSGISRLGAASLAIGNGTASDTTGNLSFNKVIKYAGVATVSAGVPSELATVDLTAQSAAIAAGTALYSVPATGAGLYRVSCYAKITTVSDISSTLGGAGGFVLTWTDPTDSTTPTAVTFSDQSSQSLLGNTTTTVYITSAVVACKASTNLQYGFGYTDSHTSTAMVYKLSVKVEYLG